MKREHLWIYFEKNAPLHWDLSEGGYSGRTSVRAGEEITLHISNSRSYYDVDVYREGARRELMNTFQNLRGRLQDVPEHGYRDGFDWEPTLRFRIPETWKSGVYIASFPTAQGLREILFVVRPAQPTAPILLTIEMNTYQAYNPVGGHCLFPHLSRDRQFSKRLSFERPLSPVTMGNFHIWDQFLTSWLDAEGYEIDYCVNSNHDVEPDILKPYKLHLRIGHGEYTSVEECRQIREFVENGGNVAMFAGNSFWHKTETENQGRQLFCDKTRYENDPLATTNTSFLCASDQIRQKTIGVSYTAGVHYKTKIPGAYEAPTTGPFGFFKVVDPEHWAFAGTGLNEGEEFGREDSIVGVECDGGDIVFGPQGPVFTGADGVSPHYKIIALADASGGILNQELGLNHDRYYCTVACNETEFDGNVFCASTIEWGHGLYRDESAVAVITRNVLNRYS